MGRSRKPLSYFVGPRVRIPVSPQNSHCFAMPGNTPSINNKAQQQNTYDAIVVGSGISGGWAAKELCEKGLKVLLLDRGRNVNHGEYPTATKAPWEFPHRLSLTKEDRERNFVQSRHYSFREDNKHFLHQRPGKSVRRNETLRLDQG